MPLKGQHLSESAIEQMMKSKQLKTASKYYWEPVEPYLDIVLDNGSRNRKVKFIILREFKSFIESGKSLLDIKKQGISKHLVGFFSNFCQGKIKLNKEKFIEEYGSGLSLEQISEKYNIAFDDITFLRQLYDIKATGPKYQERKRKETPLTPYQIEVLYGSMMGKARRQSSSSLPSSVLFVHSYEQKDYLLWKYGIFENIASERSLLGGADIDKLPESNDQEYRFYTFANSDVENCMRKFYIFDKKEVNEEVLGKLTPLSIAVWFQDSGIVNFDQIPIFSFRTFNFSQESCLLIQKWFKERWDINVKLKDHPLTDRMGYEIVVETDDNEKFINLIKDNILPMFKYMIDISQCEKLNQKIELKEPNCPLGDNFSKSLSLEEQEQHIDNFVNYYQEQGFEFLIKTPKYWAEQIKHVMRYDTSNLWEEDAVSFCNIGNRFLMSNFPNYWKAKAKGNLSPQEIFENKKYLSEIIRKIILQGYFPAENKILSGMQRYRGNKSISGFMPTIAKAIYNKFCDDNSNVIDFCAGYGGRLFGAFTSEKVKSYIGIEVDFDTYWGLNSLSKNLHIYTDNKKEITIFNQDSIAGMKRFTDKSFDFCFTSPPYFDAEEYSEQKEQSSHLFNNYADWFNQFLIASVQECQRISKKTAINISNIGGYKIADDFERWLVNNNIDFIKNYIKMPKFGGGNRIEPIFIF
jgi:16S rRNA G966 N2-methylase RsmD